MEAAAPPSLDPTVVSVGIVRVKENVPEWIRLLLLCGGRSDDRSCRANGADVLLCLVGHIE